MNVSRLAVLAGVVLGAGCGGNNGGGGGGNADLRVGGLVGYCRLSVDRFLAGVNVTLTDSEGDADVAVTGSAGLWQLSGIAEGVYTVEFAAPGYETDTFSLTVAQPEGSPSVFVDVGFWCLEETPSTASISPFEVTLTNGETLTDGADGTFEYSRSAHGDLVITFDRPVTELALNGAPAFGGGYQSPFIEIQGAPVLYSAANVEHTVFTFPEASLDTLNGGAGVDTQGSFTFLRVGGLVQYDPINGGRHDFYGDLLFRGIP